MNHSRSIQLLEILSNAHSVPGHEEEVRAIFRKELQGLGSFEVDRIGNCRLMRNPDAQGPHLVVDAHMDEVGFMVQSITPGGFLQVVNLGGWTASQLPGQSVSVFTPKGKIPGTFGSLPPHFAKNKAQAEIEDLFIDIGADNQKQALQWGVRPGSAVCPDTRFQTLKNPMRLMGKAFDNRAGCAACIELAGQPLPKTRKVSFVGSVQEEGGLRGAQAAGPWLEADLMIVLEGSPADDTPGIASHQSQSVLGAGVQIRCYDPTHLASPRLVEWAIELAQKQQIPYQIAVRRSGGTNAGKYHLDKRGVPTLVLGVPCRYIHGHQSILDLSDYLAMRELCAAIIRELSPEQYERLLPN
jgi:endoglucanase